MAEQKIQNTYCVSALIQLYCNLPTMKVGIYETYFKKYSTYLPRTSSIHNIPSSSYVPATVLLFGFIGTN